MKSAGARFSNKLQWLDLKIGHQVTGCQGDTPYYKTKAETFLAWSIFYTEYLIYNDPFSTGNKAYKLSVQN